MANSSRRRKRRSKNKGKRFWRNTKRVIAVVFALVFTVLLLRGVGVLLSDDEERRHIYATKEHCLEDYSDHLCTLVEHNKFWYGPWYVADKDAPSPGPDGIDPAFRKQNVVNVERRELKRSLQR